MRVVVATDAWSPQVNGVVRTLQQTAAEAAKLGADMAFVTPEQFASVPLPFYPEIRLALTTPGHIGRIIDPMAPDAIHIATEGPIGHATRAFCLARGLPFTTSYHTRFPDYLSARAPIPEDWSYAWLRRFHGAARATMVSTASLEAELAGRGFTNLVRWSRGVDAGFFAPRRADPALNLPRPIFLSVGRLAVEKNLDAFLRLDLPGSKVVVGDGPARAQLEAAYPDARFLGLKTGADLAAIYAAADVFVFPSRTDTFGIVLLEALASGLPVAAFPVPGPVDVVGGAPVGVLDEDLKSAALRALAISREEARRYALAWSWEASARQFLDNIHRIRRNDRAARRAFG